MLNNIKSDVFHFITIGAIAAALIANYFITKGETSYTYLMQPSTLFLRLGWLYIAAIGITGLFAKSTGKIGIKELLLLVFTCLTVHGIMQKAADSSDAVTYIGIGLAGAAIIYISDMVISMNKVDKGDKNSTSNKTKEEYPELFEKE